MDAKRQGLTEELHDLIDGTAFRSVRAYLLDPGSGIDYVLVVNPPHNLAEVAAELCCLQECRTLDQGEFKSLVDAWKISLIMSPGTEIQRRQEHTIPITSISDSQWCKVLFLSPVYVIQFDPPLQGNYLWL